jgi:hypothetical protein
MRIARIVDAVAIGIRLFGIRDVRAAIARVVDAVAILVMTDRIRTRRDGGIIAGSNLRKVEPAATDHAKRSYKAELPHVNRVPRAQASLYGRRMGTWGHGNLENDYALDELADRNAKLVATMLERARGSESREWDEYDHTTLFVEFEILFALDDHGLLNAGSLPPSAEIRTLAEDFIAEWDAYAAADLQQPYKGKRRAAIVKTFERFAVICAKREEPAPAKKKKEKPPAKRKR